MRLLLDVIRPTRGTVRVLGSDPRVGAAALRRRIGYLPGELRLEGRVTARTSLERFARISGEVAAGAIDRLAERLGLDLSRHVGQLSKGNKQKLGIVQAFMHRPELLVLDEPTSGLDPLVQREFLTLVSEAAASGQTVLLSSHVLSEIERVAHRVGVLQAGRLVKVGSVSELRLTGRRTAHALIAVRREVVEAHLNAAGLASALTMSDDASGTHVDGTITDLDRFVKALAGLPLLDLVISEPALEETVFDLYRQTGAEHDA
jgi:ABC-2 type transport system ATP-binding protein